MCAMTGVVFTPLQVHSVVSVARDGNMFFLNDSHNYTPASVFADFI